MNEAMALEAGRYPAVLHVLGTRDGDPVCACPCRQVANEWSADSESTAPILHFTTGVDGSSYRRRLLRSFNHEHNYAVAEQMVREPAEAFSRLQLHNLQWILAVVNRSAGANVWRRKACVYSDSTPPRRASHVQNLAFELILRGQWAEAKRRCREALSQYPTNHGLWVNLLVAMSWMNEEEAIERVLARLPRVLSVDEGLLGVYLWEEPDLRRPVCNAG